jgi:hypothetical protein
MSEIDWETWLIEDAGHSVVVKKSDVGMEGLSPVERLTYCLWVADYGMKNAGDLQTAADLYPPFHSEGAQLAADLSLAKTAALFSGATSKFESAYFDKFDGVCQEIASALAPSYQPAS